jgi:uncharacterized repeat protein (TIGR02543 family)
MKNKIYLLLMSALVVTAGMFLACEDANIVIEKKSQCTVTFNTAGGAYPESFTVNPDGGELNADGVYTATVGRDQPLDTLYPPEPEREDYQFVGWFDGSTRYIATDAINADFTLTAKWVMQTTEGGPAVSYYTVTFTAGTDAVAIAPIRVVQGEPLGYKYPLTWKTGYYFDGWFEGATEYTRSKPITGNVTVTAQWSAKSKHNVTFDSGEGNHFPTGMTGGTYGGINNRTFTIEVYDEDGIFDRLPTKLPLNGDSPSTNPEYYFLVYWLNEENLPYVETVFIPILEDITLHPKWGAPDISVPLRSGVPNAPTLVGIDGSNPAFRTTTDAEGNPVYTIWNSTENNSSGRWQMLYWIEMNLPEDFNIKYYNKYTVDANFYGNVKATATYRKEKFPDNDTMLPEQFYLTKTGQQMVPNRYGYGQISFCLSTTGTGEAANGETILQQYNLGMGQDGDGGSVNSTWKPIAPGTARDPVKPAVLLIQTSDDWIGRIEVTEIRFHNDPDAVSVAN